MTLLVPFFIGTASPTDLHRKLLTTCFPNKLSWLFLHILGCAGRLIHSSTLLRTLTIAHLLNRFIAMLYSLIECLFLKCYLALLLKSLLTNLLHRRFKLSNIGVVALLSVLVGTLKYWFLLQGAHRLSFLNTTKPSFRICGTTSKINSSSVNIELLSFSSSCCMVGL